MGKWPEVKNHEEETARPQPESTNPTEVEINEAGEEENREHEKAGLQRMRDKIARLKHLRLRILVEDYYDTQKLRIATGNRLGMYQELKVITPEQFVKLLGLKNRLKENEAEIQKMIESELEPIPIWQWLKTVKGIGSVMAGGLIAWIDDISKFTYISPLWKYAGFHVEGGVAPKRKRGEKAPWNSGSRDTCGRWSISF